MELIFNDKTAAMPLARGDAFELDLWLRGEGVNFDALVTEARSLMLDCKPRARWSAEREANLKLLLAALVWADDRKPGRPLKYYRKVSVYHGQARSRPEWVSGKMLGSLVDDLEAAGFVATQTGRWDVAGKVGRLSTVVALDPFRRLYMKCGVTAADITSDLARPVVFLKTAEKRRIDLPQDHPDCLWLDHMEGCVRAFNGFIRQWRIDLPSELQTFERGGELQQVNLADNQLHRVFNNVRPGEFNLDQGGRFYGGWWQNLPADHRAFLTIEGEEVAELDFQAMHPTMLYHQARLPLEGDPYAIPALIGLSDEQGAGQLRKTVKKLFNTMVNCSPAQLRGLRHTDSHAYCTANSLSLPEGVTLQDAMGLITEHHLPIADKFGSGEGLKLQRLDAAICERVISECVERQLPVLPVHDSFISRQRDKEGLRGAMHNAYYDLLSRVPVIEEKAKPMRCPDRNPIRIGEGDRSIDLKSWEIGDFKLWVDGCNLFKEEGPLPSGLLH